MRSKISIVVSRSITKLNRGINNSFVGMDKAIESKRKDRQAKIEELLTAAGSNYNTAVPTTWSEQAQLAADGKFEELEALKLALDAGKKVD